MPNTILLNPTLEEHLDLVCKLVDAQLGKAPGKLTEYTIYSLSDAVGINQNYVLTHPLIQFNVDPLLADKLEQQRIIDVFEPLVEGAGSFGQIYPVVRSIVFHDDKPAFDDKNHVIKRINLKAGLAADKPNKPPAAIRAVRREQYIGSHFLGSYYQAVEEADAAFLHMERAPGKSLNAYLNKLNAPQFLSLACALLEQIPPQLQQIISYGKHAGKRIVHCDITIHNILADFIDGKWTVKLVDFGYAKAQGLEECYLSKKARGTTWHYDATMFRSAKKGEPLAFTKETDIYALYNVLVELAGSLNRIDLRKDHSALLRELEHPSLERLFQGMDLPPPVKTQLTTLVQGMLNPDRSSRLSVVAALDGFKMAASAIDMSSLSNPIEVESEEEPPLTLDTLKQLLDLPLQEDREKLETWIHYFQKIYNHLSEAEQVKGMRYAQQRKTISYQHDVYIRYHEQLKHYDERTAARLVMRHTSLIARIARYAVSINFHWDKKYSDLIRHLALQVSDEDVEACNKLVDFQKRQLKIQSHEDDKACTRPLFLHLETLLNDALLMPTEAWLKILPEFIEDFAKKHEFLCMLNEFFEETSLLAESKLFSPDFLKTVTSWFIKFSTDGIKIKESSAELIKELNLRITLFQQLSQYQGLIFLMEDSVEDEDVLIEEFTDYTPNAIKKLISNLRFDNSEQINHLIQTLGLLPYCHDISALLGVFSHQYPSLGKKIRQQLQELLRTHTGTELNQHLIAFHLDLHTSQTLNLYLTELAAELDDLDAIKRSIPYLLEEPNLAQQALDAINSNRSMSGLKIYLRNLNSGLSRALSTTAEDVKLKLLAEYQLFYKEPFRYNPYRSTPVTEHGIFPSVKATATEPSEEALLDDLSLT